MIEDNLYLLGEVYDFDVEKDEDKIILSKTYEIESIGEYDYNDIFRPVYWTKTHVIEIEDKNNEFNITIYDIYNTYLDGGRSILLFIEREYLSTDVNSWDKYDYKYYLRRILFNSTYDLKSIEGRQFHITEESDKKLMNLPIKEDVDINILDVTEFNDDVSTNTYVYVEFFVDVKKHVTHKQSYAFQFIKDHITNLEGSSFKYDIASMFDF